MTSSKSEFIEPNIVPASSICNSIFDGTHDSPKRQDYGFKLVTSRHIKANKVLLEDAYFINENDFININKRSRLQIGDVLFTMIGTVGEVCRISTEPDFAIKNIGVFRPTEASDSVWIYYYLLSPEGRRNIEAAKRGTTQQFMGLKELREFPINFPKDSMYRRNQMQILELLDAKIDANESLSKTLEDIAQTIFKSWFIDFDPVKAKMAGEKPAGMDAATAALFPDSMEESELGLIPKGWEVDSLDAISDYLNGLAMQKFPVIDEKEQLPVIKIAQLRAGSTQGADMASGLLDPRFIVKDGDILFSWSGTLEVETWTGGPGALNQHLFKVTGKKVPDWYSYLSTKSFLRFFREIASGKATTMGHIQRGHLSESKLAVPNRELLKRVTEIIEPIISLRVNTSIESRKFAEIRDSLLPRLISGELQIPEEMLAS